MATPTLILWGSEDNVSPLRVGKILQYHLKNSHLIVYDKIGHTPMLEAPEIWTNAVCERLLR